MKDPFNVKNLPFLVLVMLLAMSIIMLIAFSKTLPASNMSKYIASHEGTYASITTCVNTYAVEDKSRVVITFDRAPRVAVEAPRGGSDLVDAAHLERGVCAWYLVYTDNAGRTSVVASNKED